MRLPTQTVIQMYQDNLFRIAFSICQNREDAEDVVQETFLRYHSGAVDFNDEMHIRAWLIRVTINQSKKYASHLLAQEPDIIGRLYGTTEFF